MPGEREWTIQDTDWIEAPDGGYIPRRKKEPEPPDPPAPPTGPVWHAESSVQAMREMLRKDWTILGTCALHGLVYVGESGGVYVFRCPAGDHELVFRVTADHDYTMETQPVRKRTTRRLL
jgi:hypothetical protein